MPISPKNKSLRGTSGPEETPDLEISNEPTPTSESEIIPNQQENNTPASAGADAPVAEDSGEPKPSLYSATDAKLASRMSREIAQHLGLSGKSRSVRI